KQIARFSYPSGVTVYNDTIYVSDTENNSIRKITTDGAVHTVGFKINKPSGIHMVGKELYVCSMEDHKIYVLQYDKLVRTIGGEKGYVNGRVEVAKFSRPTDVFSYKDDIYVVDSGNHAIRKISETKNKIRKVETVLGGKIGFRDEKTKRFLLDSPRSVFVVNNKLYVTDTHNSRIVTLDQVSKLTPVVDLQKCEDLSTVHIYVDGTRVVPQDVSPIIIKSSTYVPVRLLVESIGGEVEWISSESAVLCKYGDKQFKLKEGLVLRSGRTFVPLRQMMEKLGLKVEWNGEYRAVIISTY
ncbi:MAG: stalk domain-containing protein, partial [Bacillota bacterium]|nr:stalk domain-containing protein [Bacillota bacterium]